MGGSCQGVAHLAGHLDLLGAGLVRWIHRAHQATRGVARFHLVAARYLERRQIVGVYVLNRRLVTDHAGAGRLEREHSVRLLLCEIGEDGAVRPWNIGMRVRKQAQQSLWKVRQSRKQNTPHPCKRIDVIRCPVRNRAASEDLGNIRELVRCEPGQRDAREGKRVDPDGAHVYAAFDRLDESTVERCVMRDHRTPAHELGKLGHGGARIGGMGNIRVRNPRELGNLGRNQRRGMHEGVEAVGYLTPREHCCRNLDEFVLLRRQPRGLGIENDHILLDEAKLALLRALSKGPVRLDNEPRRTGHDRILDSRDAFVLFGHYSSAPSRAI